VIQPWDITRDGSSLRERFETGDDGFGDGFLCALASANEPHAATPRFIRVHHLRVDPDRPFAGDVKQQPKSGLPGKAHIKLTSTDADVEHPHFALELGPLAAQANTGCSENPMKPGIRPPLSQC